MPGFFHVNELHAALREGRTPAELGLTESARTAESLELLDHLQRQWSSLASREQRRAPRQPTKRLVDVAHGLNAIIGQIKAASAPAESSPYGTTGMDYGQAVDMQVYGFVTERTTLIKRPPSPTSPEVERWVMQDESECGYGAVVESRAKDWLAAGRRPGRAQAA